MFRLRMLPADDGDCLILDYGSQDRQHHVVIDGGRRSTYRSSLRPALVEIGARGESIDLMVLSHIDADHIEGLLELIQDPDLPVGVDQVWYNGFDQLSDLEAFGPKQGDVFSDGLRRLSWPWNADFDGGAVAVRHRSLPEIKVAGGLKITLLTPTMTALARLRTDWERWRKANASPIDAGRPPSRLEAFGPKLAVTPDNLDALADSVDKEDNTVPNGASISFIAEFGGRRVLLAADAHPSDLLRALEVLELSGPVEIDVVKLSHHGSRSNTTVGLAKVLRTSRVAISSSGARHQHPDPESIARLIRYGRSQQNLYFNYRTAFNEAWDTEAMRAAWGHECHFPDGATVLTIDI